MFKKAAITVVLGASLLGSFAQAQVQTAPQGAMAKDLLTPASKDPETRFGVSLDLSILLGIGLSVGMPVGERFNVRGAFHTFSYEREMEDEGGNYDGDLRLQTLGALTDWHPFGGAFRITAGLMSNGNELRLAGVPNSSEEFEIGDCAYNSNPADPLRVNGLVSWRSTAPYLGLGWGGNMNAKPGFYGLFDIGVMFSGAPKAALDAAGSAVVANDGTENDGQCGTAGTPIPDVAQDQGVQDELRNAENDANEEAKDFKLWPNIAFGIGWRF